MSLAGIPAISIPAGLGEPPGGGRPLPVGLQLTGPAFSESKLLDAAHALEKAFAFDTNPDRTATDPVSATDPAAPGGEAEEAAGMGSEEPAA